jgi:hypothetical protein
MACLTSVKKISIWSKHMVFGLFYKGKSFIIFRNIIRSKFKRLYYDNCLVILCYNWNIICKVKLDFFSCNNSESRKLLEPEKLSAPFKV